MLQEPHIGRQVVDALGQRPAAERLPHKRPDDLADLRPYRPQPRNHPPPIARNFFLRLAAPPHGLPVRQARQTPLLLEVSGDLHRPLRAAVLDAAAVEPGQPFPVGEVEPFLKQHHAEPKMEHGRPATGVVARCPAGRDLVVQGLQACRCFGPAGSGAGFRDWVPGIKHGNHGFPLSVGRPWQMRRARRISQYPGIK